MSELSPRLRLEIFVDGTNLRVVRLQAGVPDLDIPRLARQLARGYLLVKCATDKFLRTCLFKHDK